MTNPYTVLIEALAGAPSLPGARCRGRHRLFDPADLGEHAQARHAQALGLCDRCPALDRCADWLTSLPEAKRPLGVIAGQLRLSGPAGRPPKAD
ncbi:hypothetical protein C0J29_00090 [Mycobacterium paragordonae]|nr:hypothetical protein [Mycobacterium paragordonae]AYE93450.1 hypothetical protein C0J29_00090 [Mycobacterium paragordonae]